MAPLLSKISFSLGFGRRRRRNGSAGAPVQISRSLRFNSADSAHLSRTPASAGNRKTWTWSGWVKRSGFATYQMVFQAGNVNASETFLYFVDGTLRLYQDTSSSVQMSVSALGDLRDPSAWYHIVVAVDTTQATATNRVKIYINGTERTNTSGTYPSQDLDTYLNSTQAHFIGTRVSQIQYLQAYLAEVQFIDGQALTPNSFAGTNAITGQWEPREYTGSYGTNGFRLNFGDNSATTSTTLGKDAAGSNNWTPNNFSVTSTATFSGSFDGNDSISVANAEPLRVRTGDFTIEFWVRFNALSGYQTLFDKGYASAGGILLQTPFNSGNIVAYLNGSTLFTTTGTVLSNTWYHYALVRSGTTVTMYRNGVSVGSGTSSADFSDASTLYIGGSPGGGGYYTNGYISNFRLVKGTAVYTSSFTPPTSQLTAITNTSLLTCHRSTFIDSSTNAYTVTSNGALTSSLSPFGDPSGNDSMVDTPTSYGTDTGVGGEVRGNYCTLNSLSKGASLTLSNGNLDVSDTGATSPPVGSTFVVSSGKWYYEMRVGADYAYAGLSTPAAIGTSVSFLGAATGQLIWNISFASSSYIDGVGYNYTTATAAVTGDIIGVALNFDTGVLTFYKNGVSQGAFGTNVLSGKTWTPAFKSNAGTSASFNFGQRPFAYTAPSGFKALCDTNLPTPTIAQPSTMMDVKLYTGNGSTQTISGLGFSPDLVWVKCRVGIRNHVLSDTIRGANNVLASNTTAAQVSPAVNGQISAFNSDGFAVSAGTSDALETNNLNDAYVAWTWDAGSSTVTNTSGSISSQVRANASAGFSIVTYTGNGSGNVTIGHGLGVAPQFIITKRRDTANNWISWHGTFAANDYIALNLSSAKNYGGAANTTFGGTSGSLPTSSVFTVGIDLNGSSATFVAYCFAPVTGYSSFGSYTGNASADGPFVYTGFRPRWILFKNSSVGVEDWWLHDTARNTYNVMTSLLVPNTSNAEGTNVAHSVDALSNGFKIRTTAQGVNGSGHTIVYAAFAENPFQYSRAR